MLELYKNIKKFRQMYGISQAELAKKTGYTDRSSIAKIERGDVDLPQSKIMAFAKALNITPGELMGDVETHNEYYENEELAKEAQEMFEDKQMRSLFHMKKNMDPKRFQAHVDMMKEMYRLERPEDFPEDWTD